MMQLRWHDRQLIFLLWLIFLLKGIVWGIATPLWQGPDEDDHYAVIQFIAEIGRLPDVGDEILPDEVTLSRQIADVGRLDYNPEQRQLFSETPIGPNEAQFGQLDPAERYTFDLNSIAKLTHATPLYYLIGAAVYKAWPHGTLIDRVFIQRALSVLLSSPLIYLAWQITRLITPHNRDLQRTVPFLVAWHPMITAITAIVTVDGLYFTLYALATYLGLLILRDGFTRRYAIAIALTFVGGVLIKPTMSGFAPLILLIGLCELWRVIRHPNTSPPLTTLIANGLLSAILVAIPLAWWVQRSLRLNNDPLYFNPILKGHRLITNPVYDYPFWQHALDYYRSVWGGIFISWWGHFGWVDTALDGWIYHLLRFLTILALIGLIVIWARHRPNPATTRRALYLALTILIPIIMLQYYDLTFWHQYGVGRGLQGRYWLGTVIPMLLLWTVGVQGWLPTRFRPIFHMMLRLSFVLLTLGALLFTLLPRYYG